MMFGTTPDQLFTEAISTYKDRLISLYKNRTKLIAERDTLRFQYTTSIKNKFVSIFEDLMKQNYLDSLKIQWAVQQAGFLESFIYWLQRSIPMQDLNGAQSDKWAIAYPGAGDYQSFNVLATTQKLFKDKFSNDVAWYKNYTPVDSAQKLVESSFLSQLTFWDGIQYIPFSFDKDYLEIFKSRFAPTDTVYDHEYFTGLINRSYSAGNLKNVIDEAKDVYYKIIDRTLELSRVQKEIDALEADLYSTVDAYKTQYGASALCASNVIKEINSESTVSQTIFDSPVGKLIVDCPIVQPVQELTTQVVLTPKVEAKKSLPWGLIVGAAAIYTLTRE